MNTLAYVTTYDAANVRNWSGIPAHMLSAFDAETMTIERVGPLHEHRAPLYMAKQAAYAIARRRHLRDREPTILRHYGEQVARRVRQTAADVVLSPGTIPISYLSCPQPIVFWTDATFAAMVDFYPEFSNLSAATIRNGNAAEQSALARCTLAIYSSEWAAATALEHYDVEDSKVAVVPFGANLDDGWSRADALAMVNDRPADRCQLLFVGVDGARKGADVAYEVVAQLNDGGLATDLTVVGHEPRANEASEHVRATGYIDKSSVAGRAAFHALYARSHFLVLPTKADCAPVVLAEANAFGVPCLVSDVGGISSIVKANVNGRLFPVDAPASAYCAYIAAVMADAGRYRDLALRSVEEYEARLNWVVACSTVAKLMRERCS